MASVEVDFEVFKELTRRRATETVTYNDVIREALGLGTVANNEPADISSKGLTAKGVFFPEGTLFRATYKGRTYTAVIRNGMLYRPENNRVHPSFSHAAGKITGKNWNGWRFWECQRPGETDWHLIENLRIPTLDDVL
jgi:hypothetical protein